MSTPQGIYLSIVIPAFNEARRLPANLAQTAAFCGTLPFAWEILVVVEKSADATLELARQIAAQHPQIQVIDNQVQRGKGFAVRTGLLRAQGQVVFYMDADLSVPLEEIRAFLRHFERHPETDLIVGNRQHPESLILKRQNPLRQKMGQAFNLLLRRLAAVDLRDTQCGFKAFRRRAAREIFARQELDGFAFDVEVLLLARELGLQVADLPVRWINSTDSKVRIFRDSWRMLRDVLRIRRRLRRKAPSA